jgi:ATP-dependent Clp protease adaptor protein ClpS
MPKSTTAHAQADAAPQAEPAARPRERRMQNPRRKQQPRYNVVLWDDNDHTYDYVIRMMQELFGHTYERGYHLALEVYKAGRTTCLTTTLEHAELKRDQIHAFGRDSRISKCRGSMSASIEPVE